MQSIQSSRKSIILGFSLMLVLLLGMGSFSVNYMSNMQKRLEQIVHVNNFRTQSYNNMRNIARERSLLLYRMNLQRDIFFTDEMKTKMSNLAGEFIKIREALKEVAIYSSYDSKINLEDLLPDVIHSTKIQRDIVLLLLDEKYDEAETLLTKTSIPLQNSLLVRYDLLANNELIHANKAAEQAANQYQTSLYSMTGLGLILLALGLFTSIYVVTQVSQAELKLHNLNTELEERVSLRTNKLTLANEELKSTQNQLVQSEKMASLGSLVAGISHEINTPIGIAMTAITHQQEQSTDLETIFKAGKMKHSQLDSFVSDLQYSNNLIVTNLKRASEMISSFKRVAVDQSNEHWEMINLQNYMDSTILSLLPRFKHSKIQIDNECDDNLNIHTNPGAIYQIFSNLMLNSLVHAFERHQDGRITISARMENEMVILTYTDDGKGMNEEQKNKAFDPFYTTKRGQGGSGLGLHLVFNLVTTGLNGSINLVSTPDNGVEFKIELPMKQP